MASMTGKIAVITGGSEGIGYATAKLLAQQEATVVLVARNQEKLARALESIPGSKKHIIAADVTTEGINVIDQVVREHNKIDILVNSAGIFVEKPYVAMTAQEVYGLFQVNVVATAMTMHAALRHMVSKGRGSIVNLSSLAAFRRYPNEAGYVTSKIAVNALTEELAREYSAKGIFVHAIAPGSVDTPLLRKELAPRRAELEHFFAEKGQKMTLEEYFAKILSPIQVAEKIVDMIANPAKYDSPVVQMPSYEF